MFKKKKKKNVHVYSIKLLDSFQEPLGAPYTKWHIIILHYYLNLT